jgi:hypothetical protein
MDGRKKGHPYTEETRQKVRAARLNKPHPHKGGYESPNKGKPRPKEVCDKISESHKGKPFWTKEQRAIIYGRLKGSGNPMYGKRGEKCSRWKGGISFEPYCPKFNQEFKKRVRHFFGNTCVMCGKTEEELNERLCVHHVNYDKMVCCNGTKPLFVSLCRKCHTSTNHNRDYWHGVFINIIESKYGGHCYLPKGV